MFSGSRQALSSRYAKKDAQIIPIVCHGAPLAISQNLLGYLHLFKAFLQD